ncbi:XdhC family protein [Kineosporia rhizophila]|uniref:XdhC family protein n=1 Tax=Kineosporia TaxID=49184 RepID=UPI001E56270F|nr:MULTISPECIES: XdhC family protein [Kineosporia]MCE0536252.1 XdhC family protein [Kineosporia rhizophila]GLY15161.1 hypothetical protein Kisp01_21760 [Kineosporia sp. NBRC 101677]
MSVTERVEELTRQRVPFVRATVVRAQVPSSARAGDEAIVLLDGSIEGFVGGQCAESSVRTAALGTLAAGETLLLRVLPEEVGFPETPGAQVVVNPCLSGGALEIFLRPVLPPPLVEVVGTTPVAEAVVRIGELLGYSMSGSGAARPDAVVIASHGRDDEAAVIRSALDTGVAHVALVASRRRGEAVLDELGLDPEQRKRVSTPAGLWIGARTAPEVALSIMAEVVAAVRLTPQAAENPTTAVDPICGMEVTPGPSALYLDLDGVRTWFCGEGCRVRFQAEHAARAQTG